MAETHTFKNVYMGYLENLPYRYPSIEVGHVDASKPLYEFIWTGWQIFPNFMWRHAITPAQWCWLQVNAEEIQPTGIKLTLYNPIPITSNLSIARTSTFSAFNNCVYGMFYSDDLYETDWHLWQQTPEEYDIWLSQREGVIYTGQQGGTNENEIAPTTYTGKKYTWPEYRWRRPMQRTEAENVWSQGINKGNGVHDVYNTEGKIIVPSGVFWDPLNRPEEIRELRAGKNSLSFNWNIHDIDDGKWQNLDFLASYSAWTVPGPFCGVGRPWQYKRSVMHDPDRACTYGLAQSNKNGAQSGAEVHYWDDYTIPNYAYLPIWPPTWFWQEIRTTIVDDFKEQGVPSNYRTQMYKKADKYWPGPEAMSYVYSAPQWFGKGIPIYDENNQRIKTLTHLSACIELTVKYKKRRTAYWCPTWGPIGGQQMYYINPERQIFQPNIIKYRTGGRRMPWQNINTMNETLGETEYRNNAAQEHPREDCYYTGEEGQRQYNKSHNPAGIEDDEGHNPEPKSLNVTVNTASLQRDVEMCDQPVVRPRRPKIRFPTELAALHTSDTHL
uniref:Capsid protein n=1 Tax=Parvoviridae sp. TaxID=1940570 RepID=A0A7D3QPH8_9VIRU|nr:MAG: capsid protein [Parvoviridae sp.]